MQPERTTYRDPTLPGSPLRAGSPGRGEAALDQERYWAPLAQAHGAALHGAGVGAGLAVSVAADGAALVIGHGVALDGDGRTIVLAAGGAAEVGEAPDPLAPRVLTAGRHGVVFPVADVEPGDRVLTIAWWEALDVAGVSSNAWRFVHAPWLRLQPAATFAGVALAQVQIGADGRVERLEAGPRQQASLPAGELVVRRGEAGGNVVAGRLVPTSTGLELDAPRVEVSGDLIVRGAVPALEPLHRRLEELERRLAALEREAT